MPADCDVGHADQQRRPAAAHRAAGRRSRRANCPTRCEWTWKRRMLLTAAFLRATAVLAGAAQGAQHLVGPGPPRRWHRKPPTARPRPAMDHFTRCVALEEAARQNGAKVCSLAPGVIDTDMQAAAAQRRRQPVPGRRQLHRHEGKGRAQLARRCSGPDHRLPGPTRFRHQSAGRHPRLKATRCLSRPGSRRRDSVSTRVSRWPWPCNGWIGVVSWITRSSSSSSALQGSVSVKRWPAGPSASNTRVSPPLMPWRSTRNTATRSTPSRCAPSGVGRPMPSVGVDAELMGLDIPGLLALERRTLARQGQQQAPARRGLHDRRAASARTSAACRRAARCIRPVANARGAATARRPCHSRRSRSGAGAGSGRRPSGSRPAAGRSSSGPAPASIPAGNRRAGRRLADRAPHSPAGAVARAVGRKA